MIESSRFAQHQEMNSQDPKHTPWASPCTLRPNSQKQLQKLEIRGFMSTSASWLPHKTTIQILNIQSLTTKGKILNCFQDKLNISLGWLEANVHILSNCSCMIDGKLTGQSKFHTGSSKMVQKFTVGSLIFKDMVSTSSSSQVLLSKQCRPVL